METTFLDGVAMNKAHPETFLIPSEDAKREIKRGVHVKVGHNNERFWVEVVSVVEGQIVGRVDNDLVNYHPFAYNDHITFGLDNVLQIY